MLMQSMPRVCLLTRDAVDAARMQAMLQECEHRTLLQAGAHPTRVQGATVMMSLCAGCSVSLSPSFRPPTYAQCRCDLPGSTKLLHPAVHPWPLAAAVLQAWMQCLFRLPMADHSSIRSMQSAAPRGLHLKEPAAVAVQRKLGVHVPGSLCLCSQPQPCTAQDLL